jgi:hypothetical protein
VDASVIYNWVWPSPADTFCGLISAGFMTIFYFLRFETPPTLRDRSLHLYPSGTGWPNHTPGNFVEVEVKLRATVSRPLCLGVGLPYGAHGQTASLSDS